MFFFKRKKKDPEKDRKHVRGLVQIPVLFSINNSENKLRGIIIDISVGGMLVLKTPSEIKYENEPQIETGVGIKLQFHLPTTRDETSVQGDIVHVSDYDAMFPETIDFGVKFSNISFLDIIAIEDFIKQGMEAKEDDVLKNKRKFARLTVDLPVVFSDQKKKYIVEEEGKILNLSGGGLLLGKEKKFFSQDLINKIKNKAIKIIAVSFKLFPDKPGYEIKTQGEICRFEEGIEEFAGFYCLGLKFLELDLELQKNIIKFVSMKRETVMKENT